MTTTLREEIKQLMKKRGDDWRGNHRIDYDINDKYTNEAFAMIEKRIDQFIEQSKKRQQQRRKDIETNTFYEGWFAGIDYFKKRLLLE